MKKKFWLVSGLVIAIAFGGWLIWKGASPQSDHEIKPAPVVAPVTSTVPNVKAPETSFSATPAIPSEQSSPSPAPVVASEIKPQPVITEKPVLQPEKEKKQVELPITKPEKAAKPTEPAKPKVKEKEKTQKPSAPPTYEEKEVKPNKETAAKPKAGEKNSKGQVYVPGFGWIEDSGPNQEVTVGKEGDELTGNKVGSMD